MKKILEDYGIEIFKDNDKYIIRFDSGELCSKTMEIEVSEEDALRAQLSEKNAYLVIIENQ